MRQPIYTAEDVRLWEQRWFDQDNSSFGLMCQAALLMAHHIIDIAHDTDSICVWCGTGNNGGDGLMIARYLHDFGFDVTVVLPNPPTTPDANRALAQTQMTSILISDDINNAPPADIQIDAIFGIGLSCALDEDYQALIHRFNDNQGLKISVDVPSGLHANTGIALPVCVRADVTLCLIGLKSGLFGSTSKDAVGRVITVPLIPSDGAIRPIAHLVDTPPTLPPRKHTAHKGDFGSVMVIGGHPHMGGAVIMSAESAMATGAGRTTVLTHVNHHSAILSRSPNLMLGDIDDADALDSLAKMDAVCFGMGLGRDGWAKQTFKHIFDHLLANMANKAVILDADALWHLATYPMQCKLPQKWVLTPHSSEAARLLDTAAQAIEDDRFAAIHALQHTYGGQWVLKGANSLVLDHTGALEICTLGNAGMATAGMGDVLSGMMADILAQYDTSPMTAVTLHAHAGDLLAKDGARGLSAHQMPHAIRQAVNLK